MMDQLEGYLMSKRLKISEFVVLFLYSLALASLGLFLPLLRRLRGKRGSSFRERWWPRQILREKELLIWIHAVSLGETKAIAPLVKKLNEHLKERVEFVLSSSTATGKEEGERALPFVKHRLYFPFDFPWVMNRLLEEVKPDLVLLSETDLWPNFLKAAKQQGAKVVIASGKLSEKSLGLYRLAPLWGDLIFSKVTKILAQNEIYRERYIKAGASSEQVEVFGNLKLGSKESKKIDKGSLYEKFGFEPTQPIITLGSTHPGEEKPLLDAVLNSGAQIILAPRHPARFDEVARLLKSLGISFCRMTDLMKGERVLLLDTMGQLNEAYAISDLALVGGSWNREVGGHNLIEPAQFGVPVIFGPHTFSQQELRDLVLSYQAGIEVSLEDLKKEVHALSQDREKRERMGKNGERLLADHEGVLEKTFQKILSEIPSL